MLQDQDLISVQEVRTKVRKAREAFERYRTYSQEQVDAIVERIAAAGKANATRLAEMAVEETGYGNVKDKIAKNIGNSVLLHRAIRGMKTVGVLRELPEQRVVEIGVPLGVVAAIVPTTNPTSTVIFKSLIALKAGNSIVLSPHPHAKRCTYETAELLHRAAVEAGAPEGIIQCLENPTTEATQALMRHELTAVILATGGQGLVRAAYSSGKPALGVGPGNVPVLLEASADIDETIRKVVLGKSFDYGTVCSSEQTLVAEEAARERVLAGFAANKAYLCTEAQAEALGKLLITPAGTVSPRCVGQSPTRIAKMAGFEVPAETSILVAEIKGVGKMHPLSAEKLSPVLAVLFVKDFQAGMDACEQILRFGGLGHTCVIFSRDDTRIREFAMRMPAMRVMVNTPSPQGSVGVTTNLMPSMTLGCGAMGGNSTGDNVGPLHLINVKRLAYAVREAGEEPAGAETSIAQTPAAAPATAATVAGIAAEVVAKFLESRRRPEVKPSASPGRPACSCECAAPQAAPVPAEEPPKITIADFVCEDDVRAAIRESRKIYIGPRTIVTPAARDLAARGDVLVVAHRG